MKSKQCLYCGTVFEGRENRLYCSEKCKMAAFRNGQTGLVTENATDKPFETDTEKRLLNSFTQKNSGSLTVPVQFTQMELEALEAQAEECGVSVSKYIAIRSQMNETDTRKMEETIQRLKAENENLRVKLGFFNGAPAPSTQKAQSGLFIPMTDAQKEFTVEKFLEALDFEHDHEEYMSTLNDGKTVTYNERVYYEDAEKRFPGTIEKKIVNDFIACFFQDIEKQLIEVCDWPEQSFEDECLIDQFYEIE